MYVPPDKVVDDMSSNVTVIPEVPPSANIWHESRSAADDEVGPQFRGA